MSSVMDFLQNFDVQSLISLVLRVVSALLCIIWHENAHGYCALWLGDRTAKDAGRLSMNPVHHIDPLGLLMMVVAHVGWAKPVPINPNNFDRNRISLKGGIALTSLAGPVSNFILSWLALLCGTATYYLWYNRSPGMVPAYVLIFFVQVAVMSCGLGIFNLIPISPLDGSKILFALLPNRIYYKILKYERYGMILMVLVVFAGVLSKPLSFLIMGAIHGLCFVSGFPWWLMSQII